jgi:hypothetical protein
MVMEETVFLELIKENERQILHVCRYYSAFEWQKKSFWKKKNWSIVESVSCWVIAAVLRYFLATNHVKTAYGSFWPPTSFWSFMGAICFVLPAGLTAREKNAPDASIPTEPFSPTTG